MGSFYALEMRINSLNNKLLINWCFEKQTIHNKAIREKCNVSMKFVTYKRNKDGFAWRCLPQSVLILRNTNLFVLILFLMDIHWILKQYCR
ncbi:hypothetical protein COBT_002491 [Conglomerata obtusa]